MAEIVIRQAKPDDADRLAVSMRAADVAEMRALGETDMLKVLRESMAASVACWTATADGEVGCVFGLAPVGGHLLADTGVPWLLGSDLVRVHRRALMRRCRPYIASMLNTYPALINIVHADNALAIGWLKRVGFVLQDARPVPPLGAMFHPFEMRK